MSQNIVLISRAFKNQFVIPEFGEFKTYIEKLYRKCKSNTDGDVGIKTNIRMELTARHPII